MGMRKKFNYRALRGVLYLTVVSRLFALYQFYQSSIIAKSLGESIKNPAI